MNHPILRSPDRAPPAGEGGPQHLLKGLPWRRHVLIAEGDAALARWMRGQLSCRDRRVTLASDLSSIVGALCREVPDVILFEADLPDGATARFWKQLAHLPGCPTRIALTSSREPRAVARDFQTPLYLLKPFDAIWLLATVGVALERVARGRP